ncbi:MAG: S26 family signal peptidase [Emcibacteraceae bacterium]|nr:S26 family signal peptidase [Emcibacteraceae bacterium]
MSVNNLKNFWKNGDVFIKAIVALSTAFILLFIFSPIIPLVFNTTKSMPRGLYYTFDCTPKRGDLIQFRPDILHWNLALERGYVSSRTQGLLKEVAAISGDHVCWNDTHILINGKDVGLVLSEDSEGRPLTHPQGCLTVSSNETLPLATDTSLSYDGRYFGFIASEMITSCLSPLLTESL